MSATVTTEASTGSSPSSKSPSGTELPSDGAPKVKNPLDTTRFQQNPCLALTQSQLQDLNVSPHGTQRQSSLGQACEWTNRETFSRLGLSFLDKDPRGLSSTYKAQKAGRWAYFDEFPDIEGFPAVARDQTDDRDSTCALEVGVSDSVSFQLYVLLSRANVGKKDPCEVDVQVAAMALRTMKAGG